ncbi:TIC110 protein [Hibiscus syriacus]|uniref:TIC110 protein n=1 Tax=Hibiscus syriacus TaxID=106335 RepID=A0A6A3C0Y6_HIBSY|nr:TIC110 protein [Hibiscus syriacus]
MENMKLTALNQLRNILGLGNKEAEAIILDVTSKNCTLTLKRLVRSMKKSTGKSFKNVVADGELDDSDLAALLKVRVMLCIPQQTVDAAHSDICGSLFEKAVTDAISSGVDGYDADVKNAVRKAAHSLRLTREATMSIASKAVRKFFLNYAKLSRSADNRTESTKELKKMIAFNTLVVTELVADIKGESSDAPPEEPVKEEEKQDDDEDEWESFQTLGKIKPNKELPEKLGKPGQTEITLKDDLSETDQMDLYKTYLLYCLTREVTRIPFGAQITTKKYDSEYALLNQLGGILGLTSEETVEVHRSLAEQAFRQQAELPSKHLLVKGDSTSHIRELKESGVDLDNMISESLRENLFKKTVAEIFSSGTGEFNEEEVSSVTSEPLSWEVPEEVADLFGVYAKSSPDPEKLSRLQYLLDISDSVATAAQEMGDGTPSVGAEEENFVF